MPIRIRRDKGNSNSGGGGGGRGGSGGGLGHILLGALLPSFFRWFRKNPKLGILVLIIGGGAYFFLSQNNPDLTANLLSDSGNGTGLEMKEEEYDKAEVFEALADNAKNPMPERVTLEKYCPTRKSQGSQGSCVGWSSAYAARTILQARATGQDPNRIAFSPSYLYNQIALAGCQGTYLNEAMEVMKQGGSLPFSKFAYDESSCNHKPDRQELQAASAYKTRGYNRLTASGDDYTTDMLAIKQNLAQGAPVVIGMEVGGSFMQSMEGREMWTPTRADYQKGGFGGHAMCVIGYDDYKEGGSFQIMNSWGENWGNRGLFWVRYKDFKYFTREAYGLYPMGSADDVQKGNQLDAQIALIYNKTGKTIPFKYEGGITFSTTEKLTINTDFKVEITNSMECYTYIFGEETDGSSYVLFPYTAKHSPYCGITGTRLFPRDHSLYADATGRKDHFVILISKQKLDYNKLNGYFNQVKANSYAQKVSTTLKDELINDIRFKSGNSIRFQTGENAEENMVAIVLEVDK
jgi:hypothetical protein